MTDDIYVYLVKMPSGVQEAVLPCFGGYTIYINETLDTYSQMDAYRHALRHIQNDDFSRYDIQEIEHDAHRGW